MYLFLLDIIIYKIYFTIIYFLITYHLFYTYKIKLYIFHNSECLILSTIIYHAIPLL